MKKATCYLLVILFLSSAFKNLKEYKIIGVAKGFTDSTLLYLDDLTDGSFRHIDSTYIIKEEFTFKGILKQRSVQVAIRTKDLEDRCYFWLENSIINFDAEKGKFREAFVAGSKTQDENTKLKKFTTNPDDSRKTDYLFSANNRNSIISAYIVSRNCTTWGKDSLKKLYYNFSKAVKNTYYGKGILEFIVLNKDIRIGKPFSDFSQKDINKKILKLSDFKGKVLLLDFWGSWCGSCRESNPELVEIYNEYKNKGFEILGVAAETNRSQWLNAIMEDKLTWPNVTDLRGDKNKAAIIYGVSYYPTNFLIDKNGIIIAKNLEGKKLREKLDTILK
jgi:thiol-disulfide isomerase/thioredoxin